MDIPKSFKLGSKRWTVELRSDWSYHGSTFYAMRRIVVRPRAPRATAKTFWHEFFHAALADMGHGHLSRNEKFVDELARRVTTMLYTARFDK